MRRCWYVVAFVLVSGSALLLPRAGTAEADTGCGDVVKMPLDLFNDAEITHSVGSSVDISPEASLAVGTLARTAPTAATAGVGTVATAAALTFVAAVGGTCTFLDVLDFDAKFGDAFGSHGADSFVGHSGFEVAAVGAWPGLAHSSGAHGLTLGIQDPLGAALPSGAGYHLQALTQGRSLERASVRINSPGDTDAYPYYSSLNSSVLAPTTYQPGITSGSCTMSAFSSNAACDDLGGLSDLSGIVHIRNTDPGFYMPCRAWYFGLDVTNLGGMCGVIPGEKIVIAHESNTATPFGMVAPLWPEVNATGWERHFVSDAYCVTMSTGAGTWVRTTGEGVWDRGTTRARMPVTTCSPGQLLANHVVTKVPIGVDCDEGVVCWPGSRVASIELPAAWQLTATAPDWVACLTSGSTCGTPILDDTTCEWGGYAVDEDWCLESKVIRAHDPTKPEDATLRSTETMEQLDRVEGDPASTGTPFPELGESGSGGGGGTVVEIDVPIDPGGGLGAGAADDGEAECWPDGWGWFNPGQWVLRPIKCALMWAFVPDPGTFETFVSDARTLLEDEIPFSLLFGLVDVLDAATSSLSAPDGDSCVTLDGLVPEAGSVDACPASITVGSTQRTLLSVLMIGPMFVALCGHALTMVRGR